MTEQLNISDMEARKAEVELQEAIDAEDDENLAAEQADKMERRG